jgi:hypothetical protein
MANQMIALQARNPQLPDPMRQTAQYANMMNMASQQRASQLQAERIRQEMEYETELQAPKLAEAGAKANSAQLTFVMDFYKKSADSLLNSSTPEQAVARGERLKSMFPVPALQAQIDETIMDLVSDPSQFQAKRKQMLVNTLDAKDQLAVEHSDIFDAEGNLLFKEASKVGAFPTRLTPGVVTDLPSTATRSTPAPRATPTAAAAAPMRATQGANTTPQDLIDQGMNPNNIPSGMPTARPISFNQSDMGGAGAVQMTPEVMSRIVDSAFQTGVMAQADFDQLLASQPPQSKQALVDSFRRANITLQADAPSLADSAVGANPVQTPESQFAVYRGEPMQSQTAGLRGAPPMEQTLAQYQIGQQVKGRNPNLSPYPGSAQVPIERVRQEAIAGRESPAEAAAKAAAAARATAVVETEKKAAEKLPGRKQVSTLIKKVRAAYEQLDKAKAIPSETRGGFENAMDYFASSSLGREAQKMVGTKTSKYLSEIINSRKLLATAIKNATGMSAQEMNSNVELQLTLDALTDPTQGIEAARTTLDTLEDLYGAPRTAPAQGARRTPTLQTLTPEQVRANPNIKRWKTTDGRIMTRP